MPYGIDPPLTHTSPKISIPTTGFCKLCVMVQCHGAWEVSPLNSGSELASPLTRGPNLSAHMFFGSVCLRFRPCHKMGSRSWALQTQGLSVLEFCHWFIFTIWFYFCVPLWMQWLELWRKPVSWAETCFSASQGAPRATANFNCRTAQLWNISRRKGMIVGNREQATTIPWR